MFSVIEMSIINDYLFPNFVCLGKEWCLRFGISESKKRKHDIWKSHTDHFKKFGLPNRDIFIMKQSVISRYLFMNSIPLQLLKLTEVEYQSDTN